MGLSNFGGSMIILILLLLGVGFGHVAYHPGPEVEDVITHAYGAGVITGLCFVWAIVEFGKRLGR